MFIFIIPVRVREEGIVLLWRPISDLVEKHTTCCTASMLRIVFVVKGTAALQGNDDFDSTSQFRS